MMNKSAHKELSFSRGGIAMRLFGPFLAGAVYVALLWVLLDKNTFSLLIATVGVEFFPPFGIEAAVTVGYYLGLNPFAMTLALVFQNSMAALFVIWNYHLLFRLPGVGKYFIRFREKMQRAVKKNRISRHASAVGLFVFFILPFQGTGSLAMAFIGKLIHADDRKIMLVSIIGTVFVSAAIVLSLMGIEIFAGRII